MEKNSGVRYGRGTAAQKMGPEAQVSVWPDHDYDGLFFALICVYFLYQNSRALEKHRVNSGTELLEQSVGTVDRMLDDLSLLLHSTLMSPDVIPLAISPDLRDFKSMRTITEALTSSANTSTLIDAVYFYSSREDLGLSSDYTLSNYQDYSYAAVLARFQTRKHKLTPYEAHGTATYIYTENNDIYLIQGFSNIKYDQCSCYILFHLDSEQFRRTVNSTGDPMLLFFNSAGGRMFSPEEAGDWSEAVYQCAAQRESASGSFLHGLALPNPSAGGAQPSQAPSPVPSAADTSLII